MTPEELVLNFDGEFCSAANKFSSKLRSSIGHAGQLTEGPMFVQMQPALNVQLKRVLFEEKTVTEVIPQVEVSFIFCSRAIWYCIWGLIETERIYKELVAQGRKVRPIRFIEIPATNHFVSWSPIYSAYITQLRLPTTGALGRSKNFLRCRGRWYIQLVQKFMHVSPLYALLGGHFTRSIHFQSCTSSFLTEQWQCRMKLQVFLPRQ